MLAGHFRGLACLYPVPIWYPVIVAHAIILIWTCVERITGAPIDYGLLVHISFTEKILQPVTSIFIQRMILNHLSLFQSYNMIAAGKYKFKVMCYYNDRLAHVTQF